MAQSISSHATADLLLPSALIQTAGGCTFETRGDWPHLSGGDVSVHGWWNDLAPGYCPTYADVEVWLQAWGCTPWNCFYSTLLSATAHNEERHTAGGGAGHRTNARHPCAYSQLISFRNVVDVDLVGMADPPGYEYVDKDLLCYPQ
jgi:hypothetical protein